MVPAARKCSSIYTEMLLIWDGPRRSALGLDGPGWSGAVPGGPGY